MFENEGTEIESTTSDVTPEASSEPQIESQPEQQAAAPTEQKEVPFHEHPRWKEVMEERNAERQARAQLEQQLQAMQKQIQEAQKPKDAAPSLKDLSAKMKDRLPNIDGDFAQYLSAMEQEAIQAREELRQFREEQFVNRAVSRFDELTKADQVPAEVAGLYRAQLDQAYREGKIRTIDDLEKTYKSIHEPFNKMLAEREKAALAKYTAEKKAAAAKPAAQPKGKAAAPGQVRTPTNPQDRRSALIAEAVTQLRASKDLG